MGSVEVLSGPERRHRWSMEQKQAIVAAAFRPGAAVREVARQASTKLYDRTKERLTQDEVEQVRL